MKLKSSNKRTISFLAILGLLVVLLFSFRQINVNKSSKYPKTPEFEQKTSLDLIQISISEKSYKKLKKKRNQAIFVGILETEDSDFVPATITFNGIDFKAEIRLKGDWTSHLDGDKWSFRVKLKGDKTILGMRKFSLQHPRTRQYLNEWMYHNAMKRENLMGLRYNFAEGSIHIKTKKNNYVNLDVGIYAVEESFDKRTIESNGRKESVILKFSEDYWWNEVKKSNAISKNYGLGEMDFINGYPISKAKHPITVFSESKVLEDATMHSYFKLGKNLLENSRLNKITLDQAFDIKKLAMDTALMNLFGAIHGMHLINVRYYYNPITSKLEPISFDGNSGVKLPSFKHANFFNKEKDSIYLRELVIALNKVSQSEYLNELLNETKEKYENYKKILKTEFKGGFFSEQNLRYNQVIMRKEVIKLKAELKLSEEELPTPLKKKFIEPDLTNSNLWLNKAVVVENSKINNKNAFKVTRIDKSTSAFVKISNIETSYGEDYKVTMLVKKQDGNSQFALRLISKYPNRVDAVFNINKGVLKDVVTIGYFENSSAKIEPSTNGWYKCTVTVQPNAENLNIIFGPTSDEKKIIGWEGKSNNLSSIIVTIPIITEEKNK
jgi:hypothetical protein